MAIFRSAVILLLSFLAAAILTEAQKDSKKSAGDDFDPSKLDPSDFQSAVSGYNEWVDKKTYAEVVSRENGSVCVFFSIFMLPPACGEFGPTLDPGKCCEAVKAFVDGGQCLCEPRAALNPSVIAPVLELITELKCKTSMSIPKPDNPAFLPIALLDSKPCTGVSTAGRGSLTENPQFIVLPPDSDPGANATQSADAPPSFAELYTPLPRGPYKTSVITVNVTRSKQSTLVNDFASKNTFEAVVVFPAENPTDAEDPSTGAPVEPVKPVLSKTGGAFPIVAFSPGFRNTPLSLLFTMRHLASHGMIVISQKSTEDLQSDATKEQIETWPRDMADGLAYLKRESRKKESFLHRRVDAKRAATAGLSFGGIFSMPAAILARGKGVIVKAVVPIAPACFPFSDVCGSATDALPKLTNTDVLFIVGSADTTAPEKQSQYFKSLLPKSSLPAEVQVLQDVNHCMSELDPEVWQFSIDCGTGKVSPMETVKKMQNALTEFLVEKLDIEN